MKVYSVLIIGAGKIGAFFDTPQDEQVLTHAHAFTAHPGFHLLGFVDVDRDQAERAAAVWGGKAFSSLAEAFAQHAVDVVIVATPDEFHSSVLLELAAFPVKMVFAEKPLAKQLVDAEQIVGLYRERGIPLAVNYSRRYVPEFTALRDRISGGEFGGFLTGTGCYGKGTLHNGSHMVDLLRFLLGEISATTTLGAIHDWCEDDPTCSALLELECGGQVVMQAVDCRCYTVFEMDLLFERRRIRLVDAGFAVEDHAVCDSAIFAGYRILAAGERSATCLNVALLAAAASLHDNLTTGSPLPCTGEDGLQALAVCTAIVGGCR